MDRELVINLHGVVDFAVAAEMSRHDIPVVFATGYERATVPTTYVHVPVWQKPFNVDDLIEALGRWPTRSCSLVAANDRRLVHPCLQGKLALAVLGLLRSSGH